MVQTARVNALATKVRFEALPAMRGESPSPARSSRSLKRDDVAIDNEQPLMTPEVA